MRLAFWGTGKTAKECLNRIKELTDRFEIVAFTDGECKKDDNECLWEGYRRIPPERLSCLNIDYLCILSVWEWDIRQRISKDGLFDLSQIISFQEICMMDSFGLGLNESYKNLLTAVHVKQKVLADMWRVYEELKRKYSYILCDSRYWKTDINKKFYFDEGKRPIWILWLQGIAQAPGLVKLCIHSIKRALAEKERICLLDETNLSRYIELPNYIVQKWQRGDISNAHFADLIRLRLLNVYGGVWIDATVYFTGNQLPDYSKENKLFMFSLRENWRLLTEPRIAANWFISAESGNKILLILEALLSEYWKQENTAIHYHMFHIFLTMVIECFPDEWERVEVILRNPAQLLSRELTCRYSEKRFNYLKKLSDIHKLSLKVPYASGGKESFWAKICEIEREADEKNYNDIGNV